MIKFLLFLKNISTVLLFLVLEIVASYAFFKSSPYQRAVSINTSNNVLGAFHEKTTSISDYFSLGSQNERLAAENAELRQKLSAYEVVKDSMPQPNDIVVGASDKYVAAKVINNSISKQNNFITINKGTSDGIEKEMALVCNEGIVGYILNCSEHYSVAISILNYRDFRTSGKIINSDNTGRISWNGKNHRIVQFSDIPKYAEIKIGDTILTTQYSNIFPDNYPIGIVRDFTLDNGTSYNANIELFADIYRLKYVYAIMNPSQKERTNLEKSIAP